MPKANAMKAARRARRRKAPVTIAGVAMRAGVRRVRKKGPKVTGVGAGGLYPRVWLAGR